MACNPRRIEGERWHFEPFSSGKLSNDPQFTEKLEDIIALIAFFEKNFRIKRWERHELAGKAQAPWLWLPPQPKRRNAARRLVAS